MCEYERRRVQGGRGGGLWGGQVVFVKREDVEIGPLHSEELGCEVIRIPMLANQRKLISNPA